LAKVSAALNADHIHTPLLINASAEEWLDEAQLVAACVTGRSQSKCLFIRMSGTRRISPGTVIQFMSATWTAEFLVARQRRSQSAKADPVQNAGANCVKLDEKDREQLKASAP